MKSIEKYFNKSTAEKLGKEEFCRQIDNANLVFMHQNGIKNAEQIKVYRDIIDVFVYDATGKISKFAKDAIYSFAEGEVKDLLVKGTNYYTVVNGVNTKEARRRIADKLIDDNKYDF